MGNIFIRAPDGTNFCLTFDLLKSIIDLLETDEEFKRNFYSKEVNYLSNRTNFMDKYTIGIIEGYQVIKINDVGKVFFRDPMGAFCSFPIDVLEYLNTLAKTLSKSNKVR